MRFTVVNAIRTSNIHLSTDERQFPDVFFWTSFFLLRFPFFSVYAEEQSGIKIEREKVEEGEEEMKRE